MPSTSKARWAQLKVGLMAIVALGILGYLIILMTGSKGLFKSTSEIYTYMDDSATIADGAPVTLNGINIGKVKHAELSGSAEPNRVVRITMLINDEFLASIPTDSQAAISATNVLGTKFINIKKGRNPQTVKAGDEIKSLDTREFQEVVQQGYTAIAGLNGIIQKASDIIDQVQVGKGTIGKLLVDETLYNKILAIADEGQKLTKTLNSEQSTVGKLLHDDKLYEEIRGSVARIDTLLDGLNQGDGTAGRLLKDPSLYNDARSTIGDVREMLAGINRGEGTVGKLLKSDELHDQIRGTISRMDALLDRINNGQGTVTQLLNNPQLYESLDGTTRELQGLLKDFRANPKKFLTIRLTLF
jgi:phospholipid/cholesterol/gamma-HCH transport system substrate-binding protein